MIKYQLFDSLLEPVFIINAEAKVVYCNETASTICNIPARKIIRSGQRLDELIKFSEKIDQLDNLISVTDPTPYRETTYCNQSDESGKIQITIQKYTLNNETDSESDPLWITFIRDVTLEEKLQKKYRGELEQKEEFIKHLEDAKVRLTEYSENLELMVADRTVELSKLNNLMSALLDSLHQGFFMFDKNGAILEISSKACLQVIEGNPQGKMIWDALKLPEERIEGFKKWMTTLFLELLPFEDLAPLGPPLFPHSEGHNIQLEYFPLRTGNDINAVVVVASDVTSLVEAQRQAAFEKSHAQLIIKLIRSKREIAYFIRDADELLKDLNVEIRKPYGPDKEASFRYLHTLKGGAATFSIAPMALKAHEAESLLLENVKHPDLISKVTEIGSAYNDFVNEAREIIGSQVSSTERWIEVPSSEIKLWANYLSNLPGGHSFAAELRNQYLSEPIASFFTPYLDLCERLAIQEHKEPPIVNIDDHKLRINPEVYGPLFSSFVHAFSNSVDHGIEVAEVREQNGKPRSGRIDVIIQLDKKGSLKIEFKDDGAGIDPARIRAKLDKLNIPHLHEKDSEVIQHIFNSQFSTRDQVSETSGRGVGMDAIAFAAKDLNGKASVTSVVGKGTTILVEVPFIFENTDQIKKSA